MQQAHDYKIEAGNLYDLLLTLNTEDFGRITQFKGWTIEDVIGHLHFFDKAALISLQSAEAFTSFFAPAATALSQGHSFLEIQQPYLNGLTGTRLVDKWHETSVRLAKAYGSADPKSRLKWAGPDMSARSAITARQMETWAHGQEIYDILGLDRINGDHIRNICHLGASTFGWTFSNRGLTVPAQPPFIQLTSPSGTVWEWNAGTSDSKVSGSAIAFAQIVTQVRNIEDTSLICEGMAAKTWMKYAQCFAGPPMDPPAKGIRFCAVTN